MEGIAAGKETVNKVCREAKLCPCQYWMLVSLSLPLSLCLPWEDKKKGRVEFSESELRKLERQHEFSWTEKWLFKQHCTIWLLSACSEDGHQFPQTVEREIANIITEINL